MSIKAKKNIASSDQVEEVYYFKDIPDKAEELLKKAKEAYIWQHEQTLAERIHKENLKQNRILAAKEDKFTHALNTIIEWSEHYEDGKNFPLDYYYFNFEDRMDDSKTLERFLDKLKDAGCFKSWSRTNYTGGTRFGFVGVSLEKLKSYATAYKQKNKVSIGNPSEFLLTVKDREIRINNYLIAKPHAVGDNLEFFEHIRKQPADKQIKRKGLDAYLQEQLGSKRFFKILNALGFKGEIKKAFFYKVDADTLCYRGDKLTSQQLEKAGVNTKLFIKELEVADAKYNPD